MLYYKNMRVHKTRRTRPTRQAKRTRRTRQAKQTKRNKRYGGDIATTDRGTTPLFTPRQQDRLRGLAAASRRRSGRDMLVKRRAAANRPGASKMWESWSTPNNDDQFETARARAQKKKADLENAGKQHNQEVARGIKNYWRADRIHKMGENSQGAPVEFDKAGNPIRPNNESTFSAVRRVAGHKLRSHSNMLANRIMSSGNTAVASVRNSGERAMASVRNSGKRAVASVRKNIGRRPYTKGGGRRRREQARHTRRTRRTRQAKRYKGAI